MKTHPVVPSLAALLVSALVLPAAATLQLAPPFNNGAVLQRDRKVPVWGAAEPGAKVEVTFAGQTKSATADASGAWRVDLDPMKASSESRTMKVVARPSTPNPQPSTLNLSDVLVGEVWLCSGQSNMQQPLGCGGHAWADENGPIEAKLTDEPTIRFTNFGAPLSAVVKRTLPSTNAVWKTFDAKSLGGFSGVAYHFAMAVRRGMPDVPIGLVWSAVGGSNIRPWISAEGYAAVPELDDLAKSPKLLDETTPEGKAKGFWGLAHQPTVFFNSRIAPLGPYALRGTLWYQGESNIADGDRYRLYLHALAKGWRQSLENPEMEFYTVQLMPYIYKNRADTVLGEFWTAQQKFVTEDPHAAYVVTDDCGLLDEIHSPHKRNAGLRLALCALNRCYGRKDLEYRSPVVKSATVISNGIVAVSFNYAPAGMFTPAYQSPARGFELAGADGVWHAATGKVDTKAGFKLTVVSEKVAEPRKIRYMYRQGMTGNLYARNSHLMPGAFVADVKASADSKQQTTER